MSADYSNFDNGYVKPTDGRPAWAALACLVLAGACAASVYFCKLHRDGTERCYGLANERCKDAALFALRCQELDQNLRKDARYVTVVATSEVSGRAVTNHVEAVRGIVNLHFQTNGAIRVEAE